jgi:hypothetical protein
MNPETAALGIKFFSIATAEAKNEIEVQKLKDCAYELNLPIAPSHLFENTGLFEQMGQEFKPNFDELTIIKK